MARLNNPFVVYGYKGPEYFCDRVSESNKLCSALRNERNVTLVSPRRMGKTGLIHHVFNKMESEDKDCNSIREICQVSACPAVYSFPPSSGYKQYQVSPSHTGGQDACEPQCQRRLFCLRQVVCIVAGTILIL